MRTKTDCFDSEKLVALRKEKKLSQRDLSIETGVEFATICRIEKGKSTNPTFATAAKLAQFFGLPIEYFKKIDDMLY